MPLLSTLLRGSIIPLFFHGFKSFLQKNKTIKLGLDGFQSWWIYSFLSTYPSVMHSSKQHAALLHYSQPYAELPQQ